MPLAAGTRVGAYEVVAPIGAGGMGEVYRARDTKLKREVALKVLPDVFAEDPERMARFQREAEVLASLNHPNIAHIYGVEERALVMELVEGESPHGPLPFEDAWKIAAQIADALEYAHERGIVHRDLKPANVKVTSDGVVKLLDFGLAKAFTGPAAVAGSPENSPTLTLGATQLGVILGTAGYMAPEQAKGKAVDKRADIWSFGVVLYELLTCERLFQGEDVSDTLAQVLTKQPDLERVPVGARKLLRRCLEKDPKSRLRDISVAKELLEQEPRAAAPSRSRFRLAGWVAAAVMTVAAGAAGFVASKHFRESPPLLVRMSFPPPEKTAGISVMSVSPDGRHVAFAAVVDGKTGLWMRDLDNPVARMLAETSTLPQVPFWAPDSRRVAFFDGGKLKKIDIQGGPAVTIVDSANQSDSGTWNRDDVIVLGGFSGVGAPLLRVSATGGTPVRVTESDAASNQVGIDFPCFLPDGRHFLYTALSVNRETGGVYVGDLASKMRKRVLPVTTNAIYVNPGYLLYLRERTLMAQPFDPGKFETTGEAVPLAEEVDAVVTGSGGLGRFSASQNGVLMYTQGGLGNVQLAWFDRAGKRLEAAGAPGDLEWFSLSPDGARLALTRKDPQAGNFDIWTRDLAHSSESRLTSAGDNRFPVWSADGAHIFFLRISSGKVYQKAANGTGAEEVVEGVLRAPTDASRDGRYLFSITGPATPKTSNDIWVTPLFGDRKPYAYIATEFRELWPRLSPDGRWLAYMSDESKRMEVYVVSFPQLGGKWTISTNGGADPVWSRDGRELYYYSADGKIMAVEIQLGAQFQFGAPKALFDARLASRNVSFDVTKDGRFLLPALVEQQGSVPINVVLNWPQILKTK